MGPLGKLWVDLENIQMCLSADSLDMYEFLDAVEKSITLLSQAYTTSTYHMRMKIPYDLAKDVKEAKQLVKRNSRTLSKRHNLFGRFYTALSKVASVRNKSREISQELGSKHRGKKHIHDKRETRQPFPSEAPRHGTGRGGQATFSRG